jgi:hypothetical protein
MKWKRRREREKRNLVVVECREERERIGDLGGSEEGRD